MPKLNPSWFILAMIIATLITMTICLSLARAEDINIGKLANAIYKAENSKAYPYGILIKYKHTSPRQACINTIKHALKDWNGKGVFIAFLGSRYCPINCDNDIGTNQFWVKNVKYFYRKEMAKCK